MTSSLIRSRREELGLSQTQLGGLLGTSATAVASMELREATGDLKVSTLRHVLAAMGLELMLTSLEAEQPSWLKEAKALAQKRTDRLVRTMALSGQSLTTEAVERLYKKNLKKYFANGEPR